MFAFRSCGPGSIPTSGSWDFSAPCDILCSRDRYITHFYCLAVEAGFYSDVVECLPLDPAAQVRFPPRAVGIFLHPVTFGGQCGGPRLVFRASLSRKCPGITVWFRLDSGTNQFKAGKYVVGIGK